MKIYAIEDPLLMRLGIAFLSNFGSTTTNLVLSAIVI